VDGSGFEWYVTRDGRTVRIDVVIGGTAPTDTDALVAAADELMQQDDVELVQLNGPLVADQPPKSLASAIQSLYALARRRRKPLLIGPI
jgi:hypothetical protein